MGYKQIYFHGTRKKHPFFEGWYFKHQNGHNTIAFIPAFHVDKSGKWRASVQVITDEGAHYIEYPISTCRVGRRKFYVKIGQNVFSESGIHVNIQENGLQIQGEIQYTPFTTLRSDIMGPFRHIPFMQCNHGVLSLMHRLRGNLTINGKCVELSAGTGYVETDWGSSFPDAYRWTQCNFTDGGDNCVMLSIAMIPFAGGSFTGCIGTIYFRGIEYRLATYNGVKIKKCTENEILISQRKLKLRVTKLGESAHELRAPQNGCMERIIHESPACRVRYQFWIGKKLIFDAINSRASYEVEGKNLNVQCSEGFGCLA